MRQTTLVIVLALVTAAGCGGSSSDAQARLTVSAAASLTEAFEAYGPTLAPTDVRFSFAGSNELAAQIRQGARPDVFAAANTALPEALFTEGLVEKPEVFTTNTLVLAVPRGSPIDSLGDLEDSRIDLVVGAPSVPVGSYTREVLSRLPAAARDPILGSVRSEESDVNGIVGKLTQGAASAGFVYRSDVVAADGRLEAIRLPDSLQPDVEYAMAVVKDAENPDGARRFVAGLLSNEGARLLEDAGFGAPPKR